MEAAKGLAGSNALADAADHGRASMHQGRNVGAELATKFRQSENWQPELPELVQADENRGGVTASPTQARSYGDPLAKPYIDAASGRSRNFPQQRGRAPCQIIAP